MLNKHPMTMEKAVCDANARGYQGTMRAYFHGCNWQAVISKNTAQYRCMQ